MGSLQKGQEVFGRSSSLWKGREEPLERVVAFGRSRKILEGAERLWKEQNALGRIRKLLEGAVAFGRGRKEPLEGQQPTVGLPQQDPIPAAGKALLCITADPVTSGEFY